MVRRLHTLQKRLACHGALTLTGRAAGTTESLRRSPAGKVRTFYWFTDGSFEGIDAIADAVQRTFDDIQDEVYTISDLRWVCASADCAVVRYSFHWVGFTDGERREGHGRGTNAMIKENGRWQMIHEHLSA